MIDQTKLSQMLKKDEQIITESHGRVILAELGERKLEQKVQALGQVHLPTLHRIQVLQDEVPHLGRRVQQQKLVKKEFVSKKMFLE